MIKTKDISNKPLVHRQTHYQQLDHLKYAFLPLAIAKVRLHKVELVNLRGFKVDPRMIGIGTLVLASSSTQS